MARAIPKKRLTKKDVKAKADRAEAKSKGEEVKAEASPLEPGVTTGRPTDYNPAFCDVAAAMCSRGATIADLADKFGVHRATIYRWMADHQAFCDSIRIAREIADERVGFSLYERAVGYTYDAVKIMQSDGTPLIVPYKEHVPPDVGAQKMWLTNRQPDKWREVSKLEHSGPGGSAIPVEQVGTIEQARRVAFAMGRAFERMKELKVIEADAS
jgi:hypothetical protein